MINKKGSIWPTIYVVGSILFIAVFVWMFMIGGAIVKDTADILIPEIRNIGEVSDGVNISEYADIVLVPAETIINSFGMIASIIYVVGIIFIFSLAFIFRNNLSGWTIGFFVMCALLIIATTMIMSNAYEEYHDADDSIGLQLQSEGLASWLILFAPTIMTIVMFIAGIIMLTGGDRGGYV